MSARRIKRNAIRAYVIGHVSTIAYIDKETLAHKDKFYPRKH